MTALAGRAAQSDAVCASHAIVIDLPVQQCQMLFTPAGEELWVEGWQPHYLHPADGATGQGMVFMTGEGEALTVWVMTEFSRAPFRARYARVTPALRWGFVEVECAPVGEQSTRVVVSYTLQALKLRGQESLKDFASEPFAAMIEDWKYAIDQRLEGLRHARIR